MSDLAKRAVACKAWKWVPGAVDACGNRVLTTRINGVYDFYDFKGNCIYAGEWARNFWRLPARLPDFDDPATLGCLLALVREAWGDPGVCVVCAEYVDHTYRFRVIEGHHHGATFRTTSVMSHATEAEALVAMLEAAPEVKP